jgi:HAD superfamily hydrolase (TIGR01509 family)
VARPDDGADRAGALAAAHPARLCSRHFEANQPRPAVRALLFDFDGTLWDSESLVFSAYEEVYTAFGQRLSRELWWSFMGTIGFDAWSPLESLAGRPVERDAADRRVDDRVEELLVLAAARPGVTRYLADADALGLKRAIVSNSSRQRIERYALHCGFGAGWDAVEAAEGDLARAKPKPDLYRATLARMGLSCDEAVAFEDSPCGISAAKAAGLRCVAVPNPMTDRSSIGAADLVLGSFAELSLRDLLAALGLGTVGDGSPGARRAPVAS